MVGVRPVQVRGRDDLLRSRWQAGQQGPAAVGIQFTENVIHQHQGGRTAGVLQHLRLGEFHGQRKRPLLTFRGKGGRIQIIQAHPNVIPMRPECGRTRASFFIPHRQQRLKQAQRRITGALIGDAHILHPLTQLRMRQ